MALGRGNVMVRMVYRVQRNKHFYMYFTFIPLYIKIYK